MRPIHSRPRQVRADRGLPQRGGLFLFTKMKPQQLKKRRRRQPQRGGWIGPQVPKPPGYDLARDLRQRIEKKKKKKQRGGALYRRKSTLTDKGAERAAMFVNPTASWASGFKLLGSQALKGITDNVRHYKKRR